MEDQGLMFNFSLQSKLKPICVCLLFPENKVVIDSDEKTKEPDWEHPNNLYHQKPAIALSKFKLIDHALQLAVWNPPYYAYDET